MNKVKKRFDKLRTIEPEFTLAWDRDAIALNTAVCTFIDSEGITKDNWREYVCEQFAKSELEVTKYLNKLIKQIKDIPE